MLFDARVASVVLKRVVALVALIAATSTTTYAAQNAAVNSGLKIVVIEGEDAANVIQQKTAGAPGAGGTGGGAAAGGAGGGISGTTIGIVAGAGDASSPAVGVAVTLTR